MYVYIADDAPLRQPIMKMVSDHKKSVERVYLRDLKVQRESRRRIYRLGGREKAHRRGIACCYEFWYS